MTSGKWQFHPQRIKQPAKFGCLAPQYTNLRKFAWFYNRTYVVCRMLDILEYGLTSQKVISKYIPLYHQRIELDTRFSEVMNTYTC